MRLMKAGAALSAIVVSATLTAFAPLPVPAAHPLVGKWNIEYERGRRVTDAGAEAIMGKAVLEIAERGDSLVGTLLNEAMPNGPAPRPMTLAGMGAGNSATLKSMSQSRVNMNGEERTINVSMTWELKADGDNLTGTMARVIADMPDMGAPTPVKGMRVK